MKLFWKCRESDGAFCEALVRSTWRSFVLVQPWACSGGRLVTAHKAEQFRWQKASVYLVQQAQSIRWRSLLSRAGLNFSVRLPTPYSELCIGREVSGANRETASLSCRWCKGVTLLSFVTSYRIQEFFKSISAGGLKMELVTCKSAASCHFKSCARVA